MSKRSGLGLVGAAAFVAAAYGVYVCRTWLRYGRRLRPPGNQEADPLLDRFMPEYEVVERHSSPVRAPAEVTLAAACNMDFEGSRLVRTIFKGRELLLRARPSGKTLPRGLVAKTKALGWGVLAEVPGREIVMGAVTQPWAANVVFRAFAPEKFASFQEPGYVKIVWTLRADPVTATKSLFRTETRVLPCGPVARSKFRKYWSFLSPGIILIRLAMLGSLKREVERRAREAEHVESDPVRTENPA
jgi:hypothetical protein